MNKDTISNMLTLIFWVGILIILFPIATQKIYQSLVIGIPISIIAITIILIIWHYLKRH